MVLNPAFQGHGTFCYLPIDTMQHYRNSAGPTPAGPQTSRAERVARAFVDMSMSHVWVRLFGLEGTMDPDTTKELIAALRAAGLHVAGWGYCHGRDVQKDLDHARDESDRYGLTAFVADVEPGRELGGTRAHWEERQFGNFIDALATKFGSDNVGISTWPVLKIQDEPHFPSHKLMTKVADRVAMFAPQTYWMRYPKDVHYNATGFKERDYPRDDPSSFVRLVVDAWRADGFARPLVITGQAYWGEGAPELEILEAKIARFVSTYPDWSKIVGVNWWHAGGTEAMSSGMISALRSAKLGQKPFALPSVPAPEV